MLPLRRVLRAISAG
ncbi:hypothetical protein EYZ11_013027 [Aspergillus tanneri]|uniref:Uncharacterized protein n=1 Tax=Aspergillus tanneri TaxID=1220188 RepID=A0A4S3IYP7_9EURO|nr:hypothetical protein EYZ11_013027 [Aspergillus tanneri]